MTERDESPEALAHALVQRLFEVLHECRGIFLKLETPHARPESASAQAERLLYVAFLGAIEVGLVRTMGTPSYGRPASRPVGGQARDGANGTGSAA